MIELAEFQLEDLRMEEFPRLAEIVYDDDSWTDMQRDLLRAEALDFLGWAGMEAYQAFE